MANVNIFLLFWIINTVISQNINNDVTLSLIDGFDSSAVREGELLKLQCTQFVSAVGSFHWELVKGMTTTTLTESDRISIDLGVSTDGQPKSTLSIPNIERSDEGTYRCVFIINGGGQINSSLDVKLVHHPAPSCYKAHHDLIQHGTTTLLCSSLPSYPNITIQWEDLETEDIITGSVSENNGPDRLVYNTLSYSKIIPEGNITRMQCVVTNPAFPGVQKTCDYIKRESGTTTIRSTFHAFKISATTESKLTYASNVTKGLSPKAGAVFGMTEIILIAAIGGLIVLILLILAIFLIVKCCCSSRKNKDHRDLGVAYRTDGDIDDVKAPEYPVKDNFEKMESGDLSKAPSVDDLNVLSTLSAIKDAKKEDKLLNISINSSKLYDSVCIDYY